jgi:TRAP-type C4-dicarboxylate transport system permease small subunit
MAELSKSDHPSALTERNPFERVLFYIGAAALLTIMLVETVSVLGRHTSLPLIGAIEIIQACIIVVACASTVLTTLKSAHARVHLVLSKLSPSSRVALTRVSSMLSSLFFVSLAAGSFWLAHDTWNTFEETEVLHISFRPLRAAVVLAMVMAALVFLYNALRRSATR